jgi:hypothetical protein
VKTAQEEPATRAIGQSNKRDQKDHVDINRRSQQGRVEQKRAFHNNKEETKEEKQIAMTT